MLKAIMAIALIGIVLGLTFVFVFDGYNKVKSFFKAPEEKQIDLYSNKYDIAPPEIKNIKEVGHES